MILNRTGVLNDPKKNVNATVENFLLTVVKGHLLAVAYVVLGITKLDAPINLPPFLKSRSNEQYSFLKSIAMQVVDKCTIVEGAITGDPVEVTKDCVHNYAHVLCHLGSLVMEVRDAWAEGDEERLASPTTV